SMEKSSGRDTLLSIQPLGDQHLSFDEAGDIIGQSPGSAKEVTPAEQDAIVLEQLDRLGITQRSRQAYVSTRIQTPQGVVSTELTGVDPAYGTMYRVQIAEGRWLTDSDHRRLAPALVVNQPLYEQLGRPDLDTETITLYGHSGTSEKEIATVVGVMVADPSTDWAPQAYLAVGGLSAVPGAGPEAASVSQYLAWVPPEQGEEVRRHLAQRLSSTAAGSFEVYPTSFGMEQMQVFSMFGYAIAGVAVVILLLGAMGLVNISLVTVRYRVREIGIRRSYGATGGRIFVGVLMESVVATVIAGAVGVAAAVALVKAPFVTDVFARAGLVDLPPFPVGAVITGLAAATAVGVLAGALPALIATRIRVIDAIRS
ncbi:MAG TPA: ABC transporter permease, partial [Brachybacterium massiliense]|nr:ABC transporter permease [Brachybacterium massiliense]